MALIEDNIRGERVYMPTPDQRPNLIPHAMAYSLALPFVQGKRVLEIGCGTGYGTKLLAEAAKVVIGIDYSKTAIEHARRWKPGNCEFLCKDADNDLPFWVYEPEVIVAMQSLEHLDDPKKIIEMYGHCTWIFALPHDGLDIEFHHYSISEQLIWEWFSAKARLQYFDDLGHLYDKPTDGFTNYFGIYIPQKG